MRSAAAASQNEALRLHRPRRRPRPEREIAIRHGPAAPPRRPVAVVLVAAPSWGVDGAASAAYALALVLANFLLAAALLGGPPASPTRC